MNSELETALESFRLHLYSELKLKASTIENYVGVLKRAAKVIGLRPSLESAKDYLATMRKNGSRYAHLTVTAVGLERYMNSVGAHCRLPRPSKPPRRKIEPLTSFEVSLILWKCSNLRQKTMLSLLAYSGIRNAELCSLCIGDIDIGNRIVTIRNGKGGKSRTVCIAGDCIEIVNEYLQHRGGNSEQLLFLTARNGNPLEPQDIRKLVRCAAQRAGIDYKRVYPHLFRHSLACNLIENGADLFTVQYQLGHEHLTTTMEYLHPNAQHASTQYHAFVPKYAAGRLNRQNRFR